MNADEIARLQDRMRQPKMARQSANKALELSPHNLAAMEILAALEVREGNLDEGERVYRAALSMAHKPELQVPIGKAIASIHEKRKEWDLAFAAHEKANLIRFRSDAARDARQVVGRDLLGPILGQVANLDARFAFRHGSFLPSSLAHLSFGVSAVAAVD